VLLATAMMPTETESGSSNHSQNIETYYFSAYEINLYNGTACHLLHTRGNKFLSYHVFEKKLCRHFCTSEFEEK
jgi:hypothetical protein